MSESIGLGLIGAGRIGRIHAENATHTAGCHLAAVTDEIEQAAATVAAEHGAVMLADAHALIDDPTIRAVLICAPTPTHVPLIEACAKAKKAVFCEKPLALDLESIDRALAAVEAASIPLMVGFNRRFDPSFRELAEQLHAGAIGPAHVIRITSRDPGPPPIEYVRQSGGLFLDMMIHDLDMARWLGKSEVRRVQAAGACRIDPAIGEAGDIDTAVVTLELANGTIATIDNSRRATYGYDQRIEVLGAGGMLSAGNVHPHTTARADATGIHGPRPHHFFLERYAEAYRRELAAFVACVRDGTPSPIDGRDGRAPVAIALAAQRALKEGRAVEVTG